MNAHQSLHNDTVRNDDRRFDRLVDGELSQEEYRSLLAALDEEPALWRRCALAFLEARALSHELTAVRSGLAPRRAAAVAKPAPPVATAGKAWRWPLALAASFVVAFSLGMVAANWLTSQPIAHIVNRMPRLRQANEPAVPHPQPSAPEITLTGNPQPIGNVQVAFSGDSRSSAEPMEVPVYDYESVREQWLTAHEPALSEQLIEGLRSRGHEVRYEQTLIPVALDDGRQLVFPVEQYQITPVNWKAY